MGARPPLGWARAGLPAAALASLLAGCATPAPPRAGPRPEQPAPELQPPPARAAACGMDVGRLLADELELRPEAAPQDLYKLLHEAILGPGHLLEDPAARARLDQELARVGPPGPGERITELLDEREGTVRVNLRRWRFVKGSSADLWPVLERSARALGAGDRERLAACLVEASGPEGAMALGARQAGFAAYVAERRAGGYPAVHHSEGYSAAHQPAYRVVLRRFLPSWCTAPPPNAG